MLQRTPVYCIIYKFEFSYLTPEVRVKSKITKEIYNFLSVKVFPAKYITKNVIFKRLSSKLCDFLVKKLGALKKNAANFNKSLSFILMKKNIVQRT